MPRNEAKRIADNLRFTRDVVDGRDVIRYEPWGGNDKLHDFAQRWKQSPLAATELAFECGTTAAWDKEKEVCVCSERGREWVFAEGGSVCTPRRSEE